ARLINLRLFPLIHVSHVVLPETATAREQSAEEDHPIQRALRRGEETATGQIQAAIPEFDSAGGAAHVWVVVQVVEHRRQGLWRDESVWVQEQQVAALRQAQRLVGGGRKSHVPVIADDLHLRENASIPIRVKGAAGVVH